MAAKAASQSSLGDFNIGTHVMLGGIGFQLVSMSIFCVLWLLFLFRARKVPYSRIHAFTTSFAIACIMVRNVYRAVELDQGWTGYLITHEVYFCVLDCGLMALATLIMNFFHPSRYVTGVPENAAAVGMSMKGVYVGSGYGRGSDQESGMAKQ